MIAIRTRPRTTRTEERSPWTTRRSSLRRVESASSTGSSEPSASVGRRGVLMLPPPPARRLARLGTRPARPCRAAVAEPGDRGDDVLLGRFAGAEVAGRAAEAQDDDAVGDLEDVDQVVADHDDAEVALAQTLDQRQHLFGLRHAERRGRLVEQHDFRLAEQRTGDRHLLALAARERPDLAAQAGDRHRQVARAGRRPRAPSRTSSSWRETAPTPGETSSRPRKRLATTSRLSQSARSW